METPPSKAEEGAAASAAAAAAGASAAAETAAEPAAVKAGGHGAGLSARGSVAADVAATVGWIAVAAGVAAGVGWTKGAGAAAEFVTAYIVEYSLSVDNLFVFLLIFGYFRVEARAQLRVLTYGIAGAMGMRGALIVVGEALTHRFRGVTVGFAGLLLYSAGKLLLARGGEDEEDLEQNRIVRLARWLLPVGEKYDGERFLTREAGRVVATPLLLVLVCVELSDVVFALDSVPAVLGISDDVAVIYLSNVLAIMGLRSLFFVLSDAIGDLRFLQQALGVVLGFVGAKMLGGVAGFPIGTAQSLAVVVGTLAAGVGLSVAFPEPPGSGAGGGDGGDGAA